MIKPVVDNLPVRRRLDFDYHIDAQVLDDYIPCGQTTPLVPLEQAMQGGYLRDGWMTSRVKDIKWLVDSEPLASECTTDNQKHKENDTRCLGLSLSHGPRELSPESYNLIATPGADHLTGLPEELLKIITDKLQIRDALSLSQTCKKMNNLIETREFWRHRLLKDLNCISLTAEGRPDGGSREMYRETYKLVHWSENSGDDTPYEEMGTLV